MIHKHISYSTEAKKAIEQGQAIVALESTIISHGMPYPENKDTAFLLEDILRQQGVCPATIAIVDGTIKIGLSNQEIEYLALEKKSKVLKISTKDIPYCLVTKKSGACTVAATMHLAQLAGIRIFATGGIGGVHRGAEHTFDISADMDELAKNPVAVVCAGAKSILDLGLTLEYLETKSVPVIGYQTTMLPAFYTRISDHTLDISLDSPKQIADFIKAKWELHSNTGVVITNPIPEQYSLDTKYINGIVEEALATCNTQKIQGKKITPFLLSYIAEHTEKKSLFSNIELVKNNTNLAAKIALEYSRKK